jgi:hypothetical protein
VAHVAFHAAEQRADQGFVGGGVELAVSRTSSVRRAPLSPACTTQASVSSSFQSSARKFRGKLTWPGGEQTAFWDGVAWFARRCAQHLRATRAAELRAACTGPHLALLAKASFEESTPFFGGLKGRGPARGSAGPSVVSAARAPPELGYY